MVNALNYQVYSLSFWHKMNSQNAETVIYKRDDAIKWWDELCVTVIIIIILYATAVLKSKVQYLSGYNSNVSWLAVKQQSVMTKCHWMCELSTGNGELGNCDLVVE